MLEILKKRLLEDPEKIKELLERFDFYKIRIHSSYISFARSFESSPKAITIYLDNNPNLIVKDWATNEVKDIFNYIISNRSVTFREVITATKNILGINGYIYDETSRVEAFGGFYGRIKNRIKPEVTVYEEEILNKYISCGNQRFLADHISLETQRKFEIGFDVESQSITIPIRNEEGRLVGVKARINREPKEDEQKYFYLVPTMMSQLLYGYSENYKYLESTDVIYVFESEKSVLECRDFNIRNCVALGSSNVSKKQCQLLLSLNPKKIVLCYDKGLDREAIKRSVILLRTYAKMKEFEIWYTDMESDDSIPGKSSPSDLGKKGFEYVIKHRLKQAKEKDI